MKDKLYFIILLLLIGVLLSIGLIFQMSFKYWIWSLAGIVLYVRCKDVFTGKKWFEKNNFDLTTYNTALETEMGSKYKQCIEENILPISEHEKNGYIKLTRLCIAPVKQNKLIAFFENKDFSKNEIYMTTLNYVMECSDEQGWFFFMSLDYKQDIETLEWRLENSLDKNFNLSIDLPKAENYEEQASVSFDNVFEDFDKPLRSKGLQMGFIDTQSDEYVIFIHRIKEKKYVENAVNEIGYKYYDIKH